MNAPPDPGTQRNALADVVPHIVWARDSDGTPIQFNLKWTAYTGLDLAETLRVGSSSFLHPSDLAEIERLSQEARARSIPFEISYRLCVRDGTYRWHTARIVPVLVDGSVVSWVGTAIDVDDQHRLHDEQRFLIGAGMVLGTSLDLSTTLGDVARLVVPHLADWCAIDLLTDTGALERPAVAHVDPSKVALAQEISRRQPPKPDDSHGAYAVVRTRRAEVFEDIPDELLVASNPRSGAPALFRSLGLRSSMCVPLVVRDRALGALTLVSAEMRRRYGASDLAFAEELARRIAVAVDNAQLYAAMTAARTAAEAMAADLVEQSRDVTAALLTMRAERDAAIERASGAAVGP